MIALDWEGEYVAVLGDQEGLPCRLLVGHVQPLFDPVGKGERLCESVLFWEKQGSNVVLLADGVVQPFVGSN